MITVSELESIQRKVAELNSRMAAIPWNHLSCLDADSLRKCESLFRETSSEWETLVVQTAEEVMTDREAFSGAEMVSEAV